MNTSTSIIQEIKQHKPNISPFNPAVLLKRSLQKAPFYMYTASTGPRCYLYKDTMRDVFGKITHRIETEHFDDEFVCEYDSVGNLTAMWELGNYNFASVTETMAAIERAISIGVGAQLTIYYIYDVCAAVWRDRPDLSVFITFPKDTYELAVSDNAILAEVVGYYVSPGEHAITAIKVLINHNNKEYITDIEYGVIPELAERLYEHRFSLVGSKLKLFRLIGDVSSPTFLFNCFVTH